VTPELNVSLQSPDRAVPGVSVPNLAAATAAMAIIAVFWVPFHVPAGAPVISTSYEVGYVNAAAVAILTLAVAIISGLRAWRPGEAALGAAETGQLPLKIVIIGVAAHLAVILLVDLLTGRDPSYAEATYFLRRIERALGGETPRIDFEYAYGPLLLYLPAAIAALFQTASLSLKQAYFLAVALIDAAGVFGLACVVDSIGLGRRRKAVFLLLAVLTAPLLMGINDSVLRFIAPFVALLAVDKIRGLPLAPALAEVASALSSIAAVFASLMVSPEIGVAASVGVGAYHLARVRTEGVKAVPALLGFVFGAALSVLAARPVFDSLLAVAGGGYNWPVIPAAATMLYLGSVLWVVPQEGGRFLRGSCDPYMTGFAALAFALTPAALGRCDPGHLLFDGLGIFLLTFQGLSPGPPQRFAVYLIMIAAVFGVAKTAGDLYIFKNSIGKHVVDRMAEVLGRRRVWELVKEFDPSGVFADRVSERFHPQDTSFLDRYARIVAIKPDELLHDRLLESGRWVRLRDEDLAGVYAPSQVEALVAEIARKRPDLVVVSEDDWPLQRSAVFRSVEDLRTLSVLMGAPTGWMRVRHDPLKILEPAEDYFAGNYSEIGRRGQYVLLTPKLR